MRELQSALEKIKSLEERNDMLEQLIEANRQVRILCKQKIEDQEQQLNKVKLATRFIWN